MSRFVQNGVSYRNAVSEMTNGTAVGAVARRGVSKSVVVSTFAMHVTVGEFLGSGHAHLGNGNVKN